MRKVQMSSLNKWGSSAKNRIPFCCDLIDQIILILGQIKYRGIWSIAKKFMSLENWNDDGIDNFQDEHF